MRAPTKDIELPHYRTRDHSDHSEAALLPPDYGHDFEHSTELARGQPYAHHEIGPFHPYDGATDRNVPLNKLPSSNEQSTENAGLKAAMQRARRIKAGKMKADDAIDEQQLESEIQKRLGRSATTRRERKLKDKAAQERARQYTLDPKSREADRKVYKGIMGGIAWGFDPTAGLRVTKPNRDREVEQEGCYIFTGKVKFRDITPRDEVDNLGLPTGRTWQKGSIWGLEQGGPGKAGLCTYGALQTSGNRHWEHFAAG